MDGHVLLTSGVEVPQKKLLQVALSLRNNKLGSANNTKKLLLLDTGMPLNQPKIFMNYYTLISYPLCFVLSVQSFIYVFKISYIGTRLLCV